MNRIIILFLNIIKYSNTDNVFTDITNTNKSLSILVGAGIATRSHVRYLFEITTVLSDRGHSISYMSSEDNLRFAKGYNISLYSLGSFLKNEQASKTLIERNEKQYDEFSLVVDVPRLIANDYEKRFEKIMHYLDILKPDLVICDFLAIDCIDAVKFRNIPFIVGFQSIGLPEIVKASYLSSRMKLKKTSIQRMSFFERMETMIFNRIIRRLMLIKNTFKINSIRKKVGVKTTISIFDTWDKTFRIANSFIGFDRAHDIDSSLKLIGPIIPNMSTKMDDDIKRFMETHKKVLYISFGSLIKLPKSHAENVLKTVFRLLEEGFFDGILWGLGCIKRSEFPESFEVNGILIKTTDIFNNHYKNFKFSKWAPQDAILMNKNTKLFLTHGGLDSVHESLYAGKPMFVMPYIADQHRNAMLVKEYGNGEYIDPRTSTSYMIYEKFHNLLDYNFESVQEKAEEMKVFTYYNSKVKPFAADIIEGYAMYAIQCRRNTKNETRDYPCELAPHISVDKDLPFMKTSLYDLYISCIVICMTLFYVLRSVLKIFNLFSKSKYQKYTKLNLNNFSKHKHKSS